MRYNPAIFISLIIFLPVLVQCNKEKPQNKISNPAKIETAATFKIEKLDSLMMAELCNRKILMINDANHGQAYFMLQVTRLLNAWLDNKFRHTPFENPPDKLVLFLECNKEAADAINSFTRNGDLYAFLKTNVESDLESHSNIFTIDYMIFIHELQAIFRRMENYNQQHYENKLELEIVGAESNPPFYKKMFEMDAGQFKKEKETWVTVRDKICSDNIISFLSNKPEFKAIVFYGSLHLYRSRSNKPIDKYELDPEIYDYYLSHCLDNAYGRKNVFIFWYASNPWIESEKIDKPAFNEIMPDYIVFTKPFPNAPIPFSLARTKTYLRSLHEIMTKYSDSTTPRETHLGKYAAYMLNNAILRAMTQKSPEINQLFEKLFKSSGINRDKANFIQATKEYIDHYNIVDAIRQIPESITYSAYPESMMFRRELYLMLTNISGMHLDWPKQNLEESDYNRLLAEQSNTIKENIKTITLNLAVYQLFAAAGEEKKLIIQYLNNTMKFEGHSKDPWLNRLYDLSKL